MQDEIFEKMLKDLMNMFDVNSFFRNAMTRAYHAGKESVWVEFNLRYKAMEEMRKTQSEKESSNVPF